MVKFLQVKEKETLKPSWVGVWDTAIQVTALSSKIIRPAGWKGLWLKALAAPAEGCGSVPDIYVAAHKYL